MNIDSASHRVGNRPFFFHRIVFSGSCRFIWMMLFAAVFMAQAPAAAENAGHGGPLFKEEVRLLARIPENGVVIPESVRPFPDVGKVAYVYERDARFYICINGTCWAPVDAVAQGMPVVSPDRNHVAAIVQSKGKSCLMLNGNMGRGYDRVVSLRFSPDSMKIAYIAVDGDASFVCVNQDRHPSYTIIEPQQGLVFSDDSKRLAYAARIDQNAWCVVVDGEPGPAFEAVNFLTFSPDGTRLAYAARQKNQWHLVEGNTISPGCRMILRVFFSPDSKTLGYIARSNEGAFMVLNGKSQGVFDSVTGEPIFSPKGNRLAYSVVETIRGKSRMRLVVDGSPWKPHDYIGPYLFSANEEQVAYVAREGLKHKVVHGDVEHELHDAVGIPIFDPKGRHLAYSVQDGRNWHMIKNKEKGPPYEMVSPIPLFCPRGERMAYLAGKGGWYHVVANGDILGIYNWASQLTFGPDGKHLAYCAASPRDNESIKMESFLVIDGRSGNERFLSFLAGSPLMFTDVNIIQGIALRDGGREFWLIRAVIDK